MRGLYNRTSVVSSLTIALSAAGTLGLAQFTRSEELKSRAMDTYAIALTMTNEALKDPAKRFEDETLASVLLLGLYEVGVVSPWLVDAPANRGKTIGCNSQRSRQSYYNHLQGAISLIEIRGDEQFSSETGLGLFADLRSQVVSFAT